MQLFKESQQALQTQLGLRFGSNGPHAARTMMLADLQALFGALPPTATKADYKQAIVEDNALGKPTRKARELALRHLTLLYGLDPALPLYRTLRRLWPLDPNAQGQLALLAALARDPLLRASQAYMLALPIGAIIDREDTERLLAAEYPERFSPASLRSFAQNVNGSWTEAGFLSGHRRKMRVQPPLNPVSVAFALFLGTLQGLSGQRLFTSPWVKLLSGSINELEAQANSAFHRGLLVFRNAGGVQEVRFPDDLSPQEQKICLEIAHDV